MSRPWEIFYGRTVAADRSVLLDELRKVLDIHGSLEEDGYLPFMNEAEGIYQHITGFGDHLYEDQPTYKATMNSISGLQGDWEVWRSELSNYFEPVIDRLVYEEFEGLLPSQPLMDPADRTFLKVNVLRSIESIVYASINEYLYHKAVRRGISNDLSDWMCLESHRPGRWPREANDGG